MLRTALLLTASLIVPSALAGQALAQDLDAGEEIEFLLRPTQDPMEEDIWATPEVATGSIGEEIGPPLLGPTGEEPIGPDLAGPEPPDQAEPRPPADVRAWEREPNPYEPLGVEVGTFVIRPAIELGISATDNVTGDADGKSAVGLLLAPELSIRSEGELHSFGADLAAEAIFYGEDEYDERAAAARIFGAYELTSRTTLEAEAGYRYELDRYTDPDTPTAAVERPAVHDLDATLGATQRFGRLAVGLSGFVQREVNDEVALAGGGTANRDELDNTFYGLRLRTSYEVSGALTPFVDVAGGRREYDLEADSSGYQRSSVWGELRGGLLFDFAPKLAGEVALGYRREELEDERLGELDAVTAAAAILWSPRRLTEIRFEFATETQPTSFADAAGAIIYSGTLVATRQLTQRVALEAGVALEHERYVGADRRDTEYSAFAGASYALNRWSSVEGRYTYVRLESTDPDAEFDENIVGARMRLQY